jgi:starch phosphorylase
MFEAMLPRHMQIIYLINAQLLKEARETGRFDGGQISRISLIGEDGERRVRMGNLAFAGSHSINGVSALHTELMKETVFADLHKLYPNRINNKTNGITQRRWLMQSDAGLTGLIRSSSATAFMDDTDDLRELDRFADRCQFLEKFAAVKRANKELLAADWPRAAESAGRSIRAVRHPDQAHPRIQAPVAEHRRGGGFV